MFCLALALTSGFHPTPQPPTPEGQGGLERFVKRCAIGKASRLIRRGIDPGFTYLESGNPLLDSGEVGSSAQPHGCMGVLGQNSAVDDACPPSLIHRRLCGGDLEELPSYSDDQFFPPSVSKVWPFPLAPGGRGASRSEGERGPPSRPELNPLILAVSPSTSGRGALQSSGVRVHMGTLSRPQREGVSQLDVYVNGFSVPVSVAQR